MKLPDHEEVGDCLARSMGSTPRDVIDLARWQGERELSGIENSACIENSA
jgi:hypothetical protein